MLKGMLKEGECHPAVGYAMKYLQSLGIDKKYRYLEAFNSNKLGDNRVSAVCSETLIRYLKSEDITDKYILGLAWCIRDLEDMVLDSRDD
jgi:hypothetical protein